MIVLCYNILGEKMNGIILVNKEKGMTSHDVVAKIKRIMSVKKIGHAGTLDPLATGLLVVMINEATKLSNYLMAEEKKYQAEIIIGVGTDTEDSDGNIIDRKTVKKIDDVDQVLKSLIGELEQVPPMYSAIKVDGKKLYELARAGKMVERKSRIIEIYDLKRTSEIEYFNNCARFSFIAEVSKGTYIRSLCVEIGKRLGYPAHMSSLNRISSGTLSINDSATISDIEDGNYRLINMVESLRKYPIVSVNESLKNKILNGVPLDFGEINSKENLVVLVYNNELLAIYRLENGKYRAERVWN